MKQKLHLIIIKKKTAEVVTTCTKDKYSYYYYLYIIIQSLCKFCAIVSMQKHHPREYFCLSTSGVKPVN